MFFRNLIIILLPIIYGTIAQDSLENRPDECQKNPNFCMNFCLTTNKETLWAQCGRDRISCICTDQFHRSVKVRFIEERLPVPPTTLAPVRPVQYVNSEPAHPTYNSGSGPVTELLHCDASESATILCNLFCITDIGATRGLCNVTDYTCLCQGVSPAVVQNVPISAVFTLPPPTTSRPLPPQQNLWTPITPNHPLYNPDSISNGYYYPSPTQPQQVFQQYRPYQQPEPHFIPNENTQSIRATDPINQHQIPSEHIVGQGITMTQTISESTANDANANPHQNNPEKQQESVPNASENHRQRRSAGSSYASVTSFGLEQSQDNRRSCSIYSCENACSRSEFSMPRCFPKCLDNDCVCMCKPPNYDELIHEAMQDGMSTVGMEMKPFVSGSGTRNPGSMKPSKPQGLGSDPYGPPPSFY